MNVLSLCDGMGCGQIALVELGVKYGKYYASEIDKHAIKQTQLNFPDTIQLGDIEGWEGWSVDWGSIGLILAGTPCTGFSFAGKQLAFDDSQSRLFFVFVDILNHVKKHNPDVLFLLENVKMKKKYMRIISEMVGVFPVLINSALVSAQNRERYYWSNIKTKQKGLFKEQYTAIPLPVDSEILLSDVLEKNVNEGYYCMDKQTDYVRNPFRLKKRFTQINGEKALTHCNKSITNWAGDYIENEKGLRRLTPVECGRLQTVPAWYKWECSDTQVYRMCGNGWTVEVIKHILRFLPPRFFPNIQLKGESRR
jgi:DNA (cytosine-5)-methyltransferase 3A